VIFGFAFGIALWVLVFIVRGVWHYKIPLFRALVLAFAIAYLVANFRWYTLPLAFIVWAVWSKVRCTKA
jgi:hypothetical protein